ncbi:PepSY-associated TM helix domain-containing protein [Psychrobacter aquaticus]|uniref:Iron-regulated membrane protein n=1 Tax=Psychrobacter aquaticus CMS 56 TaxID=1354303 RepID=U4T790_9GAMM|nr:PepSY-associated TM helix domain-containing protein [Psychrobacter aquaticus]ERL54363.1 iron-regulated membrane protein [Psychrobacter aquaticus CMS 56]
MSDSVKTHTMSTTKTKTKNKTKAKGYRATMSDVHTWFGLLLGWLLFTIFMMGTVSYFNNELTVWMQPDIPAVSQKLQSVQSHKPQNAASTVDKPEPFSVAIAHLQATQANTKNWFITTGPSSTSNDQRLHITASTEDERLQYQFDTQTQTRYTPRDTAGGNFFYRMHFDLHYMSVIWARIIVGIASMMMLIAIITGIIVHKKIFTDFFTFRWGKGQRSWLDAHNAFSVLPLPFHIMITFTGIITLITLYMPWGGMIANINTQQFFEEIYSYRAADATELQPALMVNVSPLLATTRADWQTLNPNYAITSVSINHPNTDHSMIIIDGRADRQISTIGVFRIYNGQTGETLKQSEPPPLAVTTQTVMIGLHAGRFADYWLRGLYFLLGAAGCGMIATGLVMWTVKRRRQLLDMNKPYVGFWLVEKLNIATLAGLPLAMVGFLWLNRLLPLEMTGRAKWEVDGFFMIWAGSFVLTLLCSSRHAWRILLSLVTLSLLFTPLLNSLTTERGFVKSLVNQDILFISFDVVFFVLALLFAYITYTASFKKRSPKQNKKSDNKPINHHSEPQTRSQ